MQLGPQEEYGLDVVGEGTEAENLLWEADVLRQDLLFFQRELPGRTPTRAPDHATRSGDSYQGGGHRPAT
jgi:hypothetical protein